MLVFYFFCITRPLLSYDFIKEVMVVKRIILVALLFLLFPVTGYAFNTSAQSAILIDQNSNRILYSNNIHEVRSVASISKIMTGILACESGKLDEKVVIGNEIDKAYGSAIYISHGEEMTLRDLTYGLMLRSGNDAALAIAQYVSDDIDQFVVSMNQKAKEIGMKNTTFHNPHGLDEETEGNLSTAYDMAILMSYAMKNADFRKIVGTKVYKLKTNHNVYSWTNKNKLMFQYKYITGGKTGFTKHARRTLVTSASKDGTDLIAVTLNDGDDFLDHKTLYEEAFSLYETYSILKKGPITIIGENYYKNSTFYIKKDYRMILAKNEKENIVLKFDLDKKRNYKDGDVVGRVKVMLGDKEYFEEDIYIQEKKDSSSKGSIFSTIKKWLHI